MRTQNRTLYSMLVQEAYLMAKMGYFKASAYLTEANTTDDFTTRVNLINKAVVELNSIGAPSWLSCHLTTWTYMTLKAKWSL